MNIILCEPEISIVVPNNTKLISINYKTVSKININCDKLIAICSRKTAYKLCNLNLPKSSFIQLTSSGYDGLPLDEYRDKGITIASAGDIYANTIAESIVLNMLLFEKKYRDNPNNRRPRLLRNYQSYIDEIQGKKVIILGLGSIAISISKKLLGFDLIIDGYSRSDTNRKFFNNIITSHEQLLKNISQYDYVISTLPLTESTNQFINSQFIDLLSTSSVFVNISRDKIVDFDYLYTALKSKKIKGAIIDKFEKFPFRLFNRFRRLKNTILLPGTAAISMRNKGKLELLINKNIDLFLNNSSPINIVKGENQ